MNILIVIIICIIVIIGFIIINGLNNRNKLIEIYIIDILNGLNIKNKKEENDSIKLYVSTLIKLFRNNYEKYIMLSKYYTAFMLERGILLEKDIPEEIKCETEEYKIIYNFALQCLKKNKEYLIKHRCLINKTIADRLCKI